MLHTPGKVDCSPADVGYDESRVDALHAHFERLITQEQLQGAAYCVSRRGQVFLHGAVGPHSFQDDETPMAPDAIQFVASMTKVFTATAVMQLVEDGLVRLNQAVAEFLPQFDTPPFDKISLFHLLTHTSGLHPDYGTLPNKYDLTYFGALEGARKLHDPQADEPFDPVRAALVMGVRDAPEQQWLYSTFGYDVLGFVIEKVTGRSARTYIEERIAAPLGLADTFFVPPQDKLDRYAVIRGFGRRLKGAREGTYLSQGEPATGWGMSSTPYDLNRLGNAFLRGGELDGARILGRKAVEQMTTPAVELPSWCWGAGGRPRRYGVGFDMLQREDFTFSSGTYCHEGWGYVQLVVDPAEELVSAVFVPFADPERFFPAALSGTQNVIWSGLT